MHSIQPHGQRRGRTLRPFAGAFALLVLAGAGPVFGAPPGPSPRPVVLPWTFAPELEGGEAVYGHAAGLGFLNGFELGLGGVTRLSGSQAVAGVLGFGAARLGPLAFGFGLAGIGDGPGTDTTTTRLDAALALRLSDHAALGVHWMDLGSDLDPELDDYGAWTLSATLRPWRGLGLSLALEHFNAPIMPGTGGFEEDPTLRLSVGFRPGTEKLTFGLEGARTLTDERALWQAMATARMMVVPGLGLGGFVRYENLEEGGAQRIAGGLFLGLYQEGLGFESGLDVADDPGGPMHLSLLARVRTEPHPNLIPDRREVFHLKLGGELPERPTRSLFGAERPGFAHWLAALDQVARDPDVAGLLLQIDAAPSWAQCWELRQAIARIRKAGKKVVALETMGDMRAHYLASAADEVHLYAAGGLMLTGLSLTQTYFLGLMEKLGVKAEFIKFDEYKSAPEPFSRTGPSDPAREQTRALLDGITREWLAAVGQGRNLDEATLRAVLDSGPQSMHVARDSKLVDGLVESDALGVLVEKVFGKGVALVDRYRPRPDGWPRWGSKDKIAIVPVAGSIVDGQSAGDSPLPLPFLGGEATGDASFGAAIAKAAADPDVVAIVVRVDSGGGSAVASDRMHRAVMSAKKRKPVIVSFGDIAASGGYYLAAGAPIYATPVTITGSIGIFTGKVDLTGLYALLGLTTHTEKSNERADMMGPFRPLTDAERQHARDTLRAYYDRFLMVVSQGRGLSLEDVDRVARGRVWLGTDALDNKLVDTHGGLWDAIMRARADAGVAPDEDLDIAYFGTLGALSSLQRLIGGVFGLSDAVGETSTPRLPPELAELGAIHDALAPLASGGPLALMPFILSID